MPLLRTGLLSYAGDDAGDDGGEQGQAYRLALDLEAGVVRLRFRCPDPDGAWGWRRDETVIPLPERLLAQRQAGAELLAPTLREVVAASGEHYAVLDLAYAVLPAQPLPVWDAVERVLGVDWGVHTLITATAVAADDVDGKSQQAGRPFFLDTGGFDGRQARTRRQIDQLQNKVRRCEQEADTLPEDHPKRVWSAGRIQAMLGREEPLLAQVQRPQPRPGPSGEQCDPPARSGSRLLAGEHREPHDPQEHGTWQRGAGPVAAVPQEHHHSR